MQVLRTLRSLALVALGLGACLTAHAEFPSRPITLIAPMAPGGGGDITARAIGEQMSKDLGQPVIVDNRPGATGIIGLAHAAKQPADGHSILISSTTFQIHNALLRKNLPFDPIRDFVPVSMIGEGVFAFVVPKDAPYQNMDDFLQASARKPEGLTVGSWGNLSAAHLMTEYLNKIAPGTLVHVPYQGEVPMFNDLIGGNLDGGWATQMTAANMQQAGRVKILGTTGTSRNKAMMDTPTFGEQGIDGLEMTGWIGVFAPAGTPRDAVDRLSESVRKALTHPEVIKRMEAMGTEIVASTAEEFQRSFDRDYANWARIVETSGIEKQ